MATRIVLPSPTPTVEQLRDRLSVTIESLVELRARWESLDEDARLEIAHLLNRHATPLVTHLRAIPSRPSIA